MRRLRWFGLFGAVVAGLVAVVAAPLALAGFGPPGCHGHGDLDPETAKSFVLHGVDRALDHVEATDAQRAEVTAIVEEAVPEALALKGEADALRERFHEAVKAGGEPDEVEALRQEMLSLVDRSSRTALERVGAVRAVLTPEQWEKVRQVWIDRHEGTGWHGRGW